MYLFNMVDAAACQEVSLYLLEKFVEDLGAVHSCAAHSLCLNTKEQKKKKKHISMFCINS